MYQFSYGTPEVGDCGSAITICLEYPNGELWVGNREYGSRVNYCPWCGYKAPAQFDLEE